MATAELSLNELMDERILRGCTVLISQPTDLDEEGRPADLWVVITESEVALVTLEESFHSHSRWKCVKSFALNDLEGSRVSAEVGCGFLQIKLGGVWVDLVRFSNALSEEFHTVCHKLERLRSYREFLIEDEASSATETAAASETKAEAPVDAAPLSPKLFRRVMVLLWPYASALTFLMALSLFTVALELVPPWLQKDLVDRVLEKGSKEPDQTSFLSALAMIVSILAVVRCVAAVLSVVKARMASSIGARLTAALRSQMVNKLQRLSLSYHDHNQVGLLMSRVSYDTEAMHAFVHHATGGFLLQFIQMFAIGGMLFWLNAKLAWYALLPSPLVVLAAWLFCRYFYARQGRYWDAVGRQAVALTNLLTGIRVVKAFTQEDRENARFSTTSDQLRDQRIQVDFATSIFSTVVGFLFALGGLIVWYVGGREVLGQAMTLGSLIAFLSYLAMFYAPLTSVSEAASWISTFVAASHRIFDLLDTPEAVEDTAPPEPIRPVRGQIEFKDVSFSYDGRQQVLENLNFQIKQGECVGIVGRSGSGKSTLIGLISRMYDYSGGSILIDERPIRSYSTAELRKQVGLVLQEPFLFEGTVAANIAYGNPSASPEQLIDAAKAAAAHDFILRLPFAYETALGERGAGLSGGERQRISIARAILYDPRILILDEATSSIDTESERLIQRAIERFSKGRTTIAIAHRLSTLECADRLLVIDRGHLVEHGTHAELLAADGIYAKLVRMQFGERAANRAIIDEEDPDPAATEAASQAAVDAVEFETRWLNPGDVTLESGPHGILRVRRGEETFDGVSIIRAFPATHGEDYLSLRFTDATGGQRELGFIRKLADWPQEAQALIRRALNRRYLLRIVLQFESIREAQSALMCTAETEDGRVTFTVQNVQQNIKWFGENGCLLTDACNSHFLIPDVRILSSTQHELLLSPVPTL